MMLDHAVSVVPVQDEYYALDRLFSSSAQEDVQIIKLKMIGWVVHVYPDNDNSFYLEPITTEALSSHYRNEVLHPDGRVIQFGLAQWGSLEQFESEVKYDHMMKTNKNDNATRRPHLVARA